MYKLIVRLQPGGAGDRQSLLKQLTTMPKASTIQDVAAAIRNWRRHFDRAEEVAVLPDGILCLKALDEPLQKIACLDQQAAFRLSQSRPQLQLDERPDHRSLWSFSQCLLAEAETLSLLQTAPSPGDKAKFGCTADKPCKYFISQTGCKAGKRCKWLHSWDGVDDVGFVGGKDRRNNECKLKTAGKKQGEPNAGPGGGRGKGATTGGKAGAAAVKVAKSSYEASATATTDGGGAGFRFCAA